MLIQHIMINTFMWSFEEQNLSKLGVLFSLLLVFGMTMYVPVGENRFGVQAYRG